MEFNLLLPEITLNYQFICLFAHPGHELSVLHTLTQVKPIIYILTDGSGRNNASRIPYTNAVIDQINATCGEIWGVFSDLKAYNLLKKNQLLQLNEIIQKFIIYFTQHQRICLITDAFEGYNPIHDLAALISQYLSLQLRLIGKEVIHLSFSPILAMEENLAPINYNRKIKIIKIPIESSKLKQKIRIALEYLPLQDEIKSLSNNSDFSYEVLFWHQENYQLEYPSVDWHPFWEKYSQDKVKKGDYTESLNYREHFYPICEQLSKI